LIRAVVAAAPKAIAKSAAVIPTLFPKGTETDDDSKALPEIWSDFAAFQKRTTALGEAATTLAAAVKAGDADEIAADTKLLGDQCAGCHKAFRAK
jgi:cytochrome c556